ncbi:MAG: hypothetical protein KatS3mg131_1466 [Candidatus Tectimicrobiota bacterium]|nr:MAG: hypothetical protein KatS3mg131_1466 [Candidatus Tectomicrobia bacterium]
MTPLALDILPQPDDTTCGPTCLHAVYRYYGDEVPLAQLIAETPRLPNGGTLAVFLALHALRRGYRATIYTYNVQLFDPTWFRPGGPDLRQRLRAQLAHKRGHTLRVATRAYLEFLDRGGKVRLVDLSPALLSRYLHRGIPILTGLSATYLYRCAREYGPQGEPDDVRGTPVGHFVVLCGYDRRRRQVVVADPLYPNPLAASRQYALRVERVMGAILLGIVTYDANLLVLRPP